MTPRHESDDTTENAAPRRRNRARLALAGGALAALPVAGLLPAAAAPDTTAVAGPVLPKPPMKAVVALMKPPMKVAAPELKKPPMKVAAPKPAKGTSV
ncbi:hypothetical protein [Kitasatospora sp. P5_F3]